MSNRLTAKAARILSENNPDKTYVDKLYDNIKDSALKGETLIVFPYSDIYFDPNVLDELIINGFTVCRSKTNMIKVGW